MAHKTRAFGAFAVVVLGVGIVLTMNGCQLERSPGMLIGATSDEKVEIAGHQLRTVEVDSSIHFLFNDEDRPPVEIRLTPRSDTSNPIARTASFDVSFLGPMVGSRPDPRFAPLVKEVLDRLQASDDGNWAEILTNSDGSEHLAGEGLAAERPVALALILGWLLSIPALFVWGWREFANGPDLERGEKRFHHVIVPAGIVIVSTTLRLLVPDRPVMMYMGYQLTEIAHDLTHIPKNGAGALAFYHLLFELTGPSHRVMAHANAILGGFIPVTATVLMLGMGARRVTALTAAILIALTPVFIHSDHTESFGVPMTLWMLTGAWLLTRFRRFDHLPSLAVAMVLILMAVGSRPEALIMAPMLGILALCSAHGKIRVWRFLPFVIVAGILLTVRAVSMSLAVEGELEKGNIPAIVDPESIRAIIGGLVFRNGALWPSVFPLTITLFAVGAPLVERGTNRVKTSGLLAIAALWIAISQVDLPFVSITRVQVPPLVIIAMVGAWGAVSSYEKLTVRFGRFRMVWGAILLGVLTTGLAIFTVGPIWTRTLADVEEEGLRLSLNALPHESVTFVRRSFNDRPAERIHLQYPDYMFRPPHRADTVMGTTEFLSVGKATGPTYFYLGTRCWLRTCPELKMHPSCRAVLDQYDLEPVFERDVKIPDIKGDRPRMNARQDIDFGWCTAEVDGNIRIGLYRILNPHKTVKILE